MIGRLSIPFISVFVLQQQFSCTAIQHAKIQISVERYHDEISPRAVAPRRIPRSLLLLYSLPASAMKLVVGVINMTY